MTMVSTVRVFITVTMTTMVRYACRCRGSSEGWKKQLTWLLWLEDWLHQPCSLSPTGALIKEEEENPAAKEPGHGDQIRVKTGRSLQLNLVTWPETWWCCSVCAASGNRRFNEMTWAFLASVRTTPWILIWQLSQNYWNEFGLIHVRISKWMKKRFLSLWAIPNWGPPW